jgi:hypothetical protein
MKRTCILFLISTLLIVIISAFSNYHKEDTELLPVPCTQRICVTDTGTNYLQGVLIQVVDSSGAIIDTCTTGANGCCNVDLTEGIQYTAHTPQFDNYTPVTFTACLPKPIRIIVHY